MSAHDKIRIGIWVKLAYYDPGRILEKLWQLQILVARSDLPDKVRNLRQREYRKYLELRQAALFAYGMTQRLGTTCISRATRCQTMMLYADGKPEME